MLMVVNAIVCLGQEMTEQTVKASINAIKLDARYLYGDATMPSQEESKEQARLYLMDSIKESLSDIEINMGAISYLTHMRLNMFRTLAYIRKDTLGNIAEGSSWSAEDEDLIKDALSTASSMENLLDRCQDRFSINEVTFETDDQTLMKSHMVLFKGKKIVSAYTPADSDGIRTEILTGVRSRRIDYSSNDKVYYISLKK